MRRKPGISLYHPPARKPSAMRRYGVIAGVGLLVGATVGLGLTQMPVGQVASVTTSSKKGCIDKDLRAADAKGCDGNGQCASRRCDGKSNRSARQTSSNASKQGRTSPERP
jgi:hypothetical protein